MNAALRTSRCEWTNWFLLGRQRARKGQALHNPALELLLRGDRLGINPKPSLHLASAHLEWSRTGAGEESLGLLLGAVDHQAALDADPHRNVTGDHEAN